LQHLLGFGGMVVPLHTVGCIIYCSTLHTDIK